MLSCPLCLRVIKKRCSKFFKRKKTLPVFCLFTDKKRNKNLDVDLTSFCVAYMDQERKHGIVDKVLGLDIGKQF